MSHEGTSLDPVLKELRAREGQLTEQEAADLIFRSKRRLRALLQDMGTNFRRLRLRTKLERGEQLVRETELPVEQISERLHYESSRKFEISFEKQFGLTPARYRDRRKKRGRRKKRPLRA